MVCSGILKLQFYSYAIPLATIPVLPTLAGSVNNDTLAFLGMVIASYAKLTGLLLTAGLLSGVVCYLSWCSKLSWHWLVYLLCAVAIASIPYLMFLMHYGSFAPTTPAQMLLLRQGAEQMGWDAQERMSFLPYAYIFTRDFFDNWMPILMARSTLSHSMIAIPLVTVICAAAGVAVALKRVCDAQETYRDVMVVAGGLA